METTIKLDRLKLPNASNSTAENIFQEISKETGAQLQWEAGSKGVPVRREPCIKISGSEENVKKAKDMLLERMEVQSNRVVMKMEVTHLEHPSLIGKGGKLIKKVMDATGCHIHFPDANKCSTIEKKNQVSIYGDPTSVERARVLLRALIPIQIYFEIPRTSIFETFIPSSIHPGIDSTLSESKCLGSYNGLLVYLAPGQNGNIIIIRCNQDQFPNHRKEITMLMELICNTKGASIPPVHMVMDIMQQHHSFVKGNNSCNIDEIVKRTGAKITFPDLNSPRSERRSAKIVGSLDSVYMAWQEIMNFFPVTVSFDVNVTRETHGEYMDFLRDLGIIVYSRPNPRYHIKNVTVKGPEKFSKQMLQYRQHLLHLPSLSFSADIEEINIASNFLAALNEYFQSPAINAIPPSVSNVMSQNTAYEAFQQLSQLLSPTAAPKQLLSLSNNSRIPLITNGTMTSSDQFASKGFYISETKDYKVQSDVHVSSVDQNKMLSTSEQMMHNENGRYWKQLQENSSHEYLMTNNNWIKTVPYENVTSNYSEMAHGQPRTEHGGDSPGLPQSLFSLEGQNGESALAEDYYRKKVMAAKAMRRPIESMESAQVPSSLWAGYGFSQSMPAAVIKDSLDSVNQYSHFQFSSCSSNSSSEDSESWENVMLKDCLDGDIWSNKKEAPFSHSNYFDILRNMPMPFDYSTKDILPELLWQRGLHRYIDTFTKEEIDYQSFLLLTDNDLQIMGISHQARMKLVCLIRELQDTRMKYRTFDAAPGAERKSSFEGPSKQQIC